MKKNKGITLIALIITIIVMLILVAVSINILVDSDLIGAVEKAGDAYKNAQEKEGSMGEITIGGVKYDTIEDYLNNKPSTGIKIKLSMTSSEEPVTAGGNVSAIKEGAPIPTGFYYVGGTLNTGVVISDAAADENTTNTTVSENLTGNQFVWVPVIQNQKLKIEVTSEEAITEIKLEDPVLREIELTDPSGKTYEAQVTPPINGTYTLTVTAGEVTDEKTIKISSLYAQDFGGIGAFAAQVKFMALITGMSEAELLQQYSGTTSIEEAYKLSVTSYQSYTDATIATYAGNVNKYGGFYIARYEAGTDTARTSSSDTTATVYSKKNMYPYNYISQTNAITKAGEMYSSTTTPSIISTLINAAAWDRTLNWLIETEAVTEEEVHEDSTSWGNSPNSTFNFTGKYSTNSGSSYTDTTNSTLKPQNNSYLLGTGVSDYTRRNNIYDLAGNCWEWTTEVVSSGYVVGRGGNYTLTPVYYPASNRYNDSPAYNYRIDGHSFRPVLYINQ